MYTRGWRKFLFLLLLCIITVNPFPLLAQEQLSVGLIEGAELGLITYEARGRGVASGGMIELTVTNLSGEPLDVVIQPGTRFIPEDQAFDQASIPDDSHTLSVSTNILLSEGSQKIYSSFATLTNDSFVAKTYKNISNSETPLLSQGTKFVFQPGSQAGGVSGMTISFSPPAGIRTDNPNKFIPVQQEEDSQTVIIEAYCIDAHLDNPTADTYFTAAPAPDDDLTRLLEVMNSEEKPASVIAKQIATWIVSDDVDMDFLIEVGYEPTDVELYQALDLLKNAGIDIADKKIGQIELPPPPPPPPPPFSEGTTAVVVRGTVVGLDGAALDDAIVVLVVSGPEHSQYIIDVTSGRGRFDGVVDLYESDTIVVQVEQDGETAQLVYNARALYDLFANGAELVLTIGKVSLPQSPDDGTETPDDGAETPEATPPPAITVPIPISPVQYGLHLNRTPANIRSQPTVNSEKVGQLFCGTPVAVLNAKVAGTDGFTWYHIASGGWIRQDLITLYTSQDEAQSHSEWNRICNGEQPSPTPDPSVVDPPDENPSVPDQSQPPSDDSSSPDTNPSEPTDPPPPPPPPPGFNVTIINNTSCDLSGSFGSHGVNVSAGGSQGINVPEGSYDLSVSGTCGSLSNNYYIDSDATITIS